MFLHSKTLYSHSASLYPGAGVQIGTGETMLWGGGGGSCNGLGGQGGREIFLVATETRIRSSSMALGHLAR